MMQREHLHLLIDEEIYLVNEGNVPSRPPTSQVEKERPFVEYLFVHQASSDAELDLLNKIVAACKLEPPHYLIAKEVEKANFRKAIIFQEQKDAPYYTILNEKGRIMLYAKPLNQLIDSKDDKMKLWEALKKLS